MNSAVLSGLVPDFGQFGDTFERFDSDIFFQVLDGLMFNRACADSNHTESQD